jgi:hypothetical protein
MLFVIVFVLPRASGAWFAEEGDGGPFSGRASFHSVSPSANLAVYDDIAPGSARMLRPLNSSFTSVDTIDLDIPLAFLAQAPFSSRESLDRLMVANLRLRLLIDEYKALQKRAEKLLKSVSIPYLDNPWMPAQKADTVSLHDRKKKLDNKLNGMFLHGQSLASKDSDHASASALGLQTDSLLSRSRKRSTPPSIAYNTKNFNRVENSDFANAGEGVNPVRSLSHEQNLPWIFTFCMDVGTYCFSHRIEALFYGVVLFLIGYFISLSARKYE